MYLLLSLIDFILMVAMWIIIIQAILGWLMIFNIVSMQNDFVRNFYGALERMTQPIYRPIRRILPDTGALDLSPMVVLLVIFFVRRTVIPYLMMATVYQ